MRIPERDIGSYIPPAFNGPDGGVFPGRFPQNFACRSKDG